MAASSAAVKRKNPAGQLTLTFDEESTASSVPARAAAPDGEPAVGGDNAKRRAPAASVPRVSAETLAKGQREISVSEFFAKNRHLLGFDNKRKALLTTVKEAVDNSLDACEEAGILPEVEVAIQQVDEDRFRVRVRDNGPGIVKEQIPNVFGKLLYGSKFHRLKMSRGQQGIGISAAGMYGLLTTGKSVRVVSRTSPKKDAHHYEIQIDTKKNEPTIVVDKTVSVEWEHGTEIEIELIASYNKGRQSVDEYLELTAIANPHARIIWRSPTGETLDLPRAVEQLPTPPQEIKPHPYGIELGVLIKMLHDTKSRWLSGFLSQEFSRVSPKTAEEICEAAKLNPRASPSRIARQEAETLYKAIQATKLMAPPTNCLSPIGPRQILSGLLKGVKAEFYTAATRDPAVYRGNPFQIEVGIAYGGDLGPDPTAPDAADAAAAAAAGATKAAAVGNGDAKSRNAAPTTARVIRFANRVPLLYQQSACCVFKSVVDTDWRRYGLSQPSGALPQSPMVIMVHMASVWVPFTSESKEAIADYDEIRKEIKLAVQECGRKLQAFLNRRKRMKYEGQRRDIFERYIGEVVNACAALKRINKDDLHRNLTKLSQRVTARADEILDDDGKVIGMRSDEEAGGKAASRGRGRTGRASDAAGGRKGAKRGGGKSAGTGVPQGEGAGPADTAGSEYGENTVVIDPAIRANAAPADALPLDDA